MEVPRVLLKKVGWASGEEEPIIYLLRNGRQDALGLITADPDIILEQATDHVKVVAYVALLQHTTPDCNGEFTLHLQGNSLMAQLCSEPAQNISEQDAQAITGFYGCWANLGKIIPDGFELTEILAFPMRESGEQVVLQIELRAPGLIPEESPESRFWMGLFGLPTIAALQLRVVNRPSR